MPLQIFSMGRMSDLAKIVRDTMVMLIFLRVEHGTTTLLHHVGLSE
jgi:hypothetical protein